MTAAPVPRSRAGVLIAGAVAVIAVPLLAAAATRALPVAPPLFLLACGLAGVLGLAVIATRTAPAWLLSLGLVLSSMAGHWDYVGLPGILAPDRLLLVTGVVATLARVAPVRDRPGPALRPSTWAFGLFLACALGSAIFHATLLIDPVAQLDRMGVTAIACFFVAPVAFARESERRVLAWSLVALGAYLAVTALLELTAGGLVVPGFIADPGITRHFGRARGPFLESEADGYAMFACLIAALIARHGTTSPRLRAFTLAVIALCALGIVLTLTRTAWLGAILGAFAALALTPSLRRYLPAAAAAAVVVVLGAFALIPGLSAAAGERAGNQETLWDRQNLNTAAVNMVLDQPLIGHGWNRFSAVANDYFWQAESFPLSVARAQTGVHNLLLAKASELGLIGAALWLLAIILALREGLTGPAPGDLGQWRAGLLALSVFYGVLVMVTPAAHPFELLVLLLWAGVAAGPAALDAGRSR
ncbi:O-antigen ligase family protein [Svornostia abyssi]|uniref:O-antigen ligase family protein n=1 Tax=Svornostia abyssi TaxID=2898438 RepID=A0ABY5PFP5_9ACTN|nr:O-antigen ligase family protein [Parviterribacteraceae bacterium J379]